MLLNFFTGPELKFTPPPRQYENNFKLANTNNFLEGGINSPIRRLLSQHRGMKYEHQMQLVELYLFKRSKLYNLVKLGEHFGT